MYLKPQLGSIVRVRQRHWLVDELEFPADSLGRKTHSPLVHLSCVDDGAVGEELQVIWEYELDAELLDDSYEKFSPDTIADPQKLLAYVQALRWNRHSSIDEKLFLSPFHAGIDIKYYQLAPLRLALQQSKINLFIADDVGLGKTIESGLVLQELLLRKSISQVLIVAPPALTHQWQEEMEQRFGLSFEIYDRQFVAARRKERGWFVNPWTTHNRLIVSYDMLRGRQTARGAVHLENLLSALENGQQQSLLILDEAHLAAPKIGKKYTVDTRNTRVIRQLVQHFEHKIFLSATPHNGNSQAFSTLMELLSPSHFLRGTSVKNSQQVRSVMVRRLKKELQNEQGGFPVRQHIIHPLAAYNNQIDHQQYHLFHEYAMLYLQSIEGLPTGERNRKAAVIGKMHERLLSSTAAFLRMFSRHAKSVRARDAATKASARVVRRNLLEGQSDQEMDQREELWLEQNSNFVSEDAQILIDKIIPISTAIQQQGEGKSRFLIQWIKDNLLVDGHWGDKRLVIFTQFEDSMQWLHKQLNQAFADTDIDGRIEKYHRGIGSERRERLKNAFNSAPSIHPIRVLVATDAAREGLNLQAYCHTLFHYDLSVNLSQTEQRNGRVDRVLQASPTVSFHYMFDENWVEHRILQQVLQRVNQLRDDMGPVAEVVAIRLSSYLERHLYDLSTKYKDVSLETLQMKELEQYFLTDDIQQTTLHDLGQSADVLASLKEIQQLERNARAFLSYEPNSLRSFVHYGLEHFSASGRGLEEVRPLTDPPTFTLPHDLDISWRPIIEQFRNHKEGDGMQLKPVCFEPITQLDSPCIQLHLSHPLVKRLMGRFQSQVYTASRQHQLAIVRSTGLFTVTLLGYLSVYGKNGRKLHDELIPIQARINDELSLPRHDKYDEWFNKSVIESLVQSLEKPSNERSQPEVLARCPQDYQQLWPLLRESAGQCVRMVEQRLLDRVEHESTKAKELYAYQASLLQEQLGEREAIETLQDDEKAQREHDKKYYQRKNASLDERLQDELATIQEQYTMVQHQFVPVVMVYQV